MDHKAYFGGNVQSLKFRGGEGEISVGVIAPGKYSFPTESTERVQIITGSVQFRTQDGAWRSVSAGDAYEVPRETTFEVECNEPTAYVCYFNVEEKKRDHLNKPQLSVPATLAEAPSL